MKLGIAVLLGAGMIARAQEIRLNATERLYVERCNIRDLSDTSTCMVGHPDRPKQCGPTPMAAERLELKAGANTVTLDQRNGVPIN
jgi:hypothetical protein